MKRSLPVGSVFSIKGREGKFLVIGVDVTHLFKKYDYMCVAYPYGFTIDFEVEQFFNEKEIDNIYFIGNINY